MEVLVSTMDQNDLSIVDKMNITSDAIIINQSNRHDYIESKLNGSLIRMFSFNERGVGKSRNSALMRSNADICLMADDDMVYVDNYQEIVAKAFEENPNAEMIMFNVPINRKDGKKIVKVKKNGKVRFYNSLKYGTVNIAFRREAILKANLFFSLLFGGGTRYGSGEDSLFITNSLKKGIKIYSNTAVIAEIEEGTSSWFSGYSEKYFYDRGALFQAIGGNLLSFLLIIQFLLRKRPLYSQQIDTVSALKQMIKGRKDFLRRN
ncbi:glycosyltransferase family 2 protein [Halalkalibacterium halodurans]|nr:glycosyltransferase family 2 protein [Halalkalibacterium halodurans]